MASLRVAIPIAGFNRSGGVKTLVVLACAMAERGWTVRFVAPDYTTEPPSGLSPGVVVQRLGTGGGPWPVRMAWFYLQLARAVARDTDVCVANFYLTAHCAFISRLLHKRLRVIYFLQGDEAHSHGRLADASCVSRWIRYMLARASYRLPLPMLCVSNWLRQQVGRPDAFVVGQGIDLSVFHPPAGEPPRAHLVVGTIATMGKAKGYPDAFTAIARLAVLPFDVVIVAESDAMAMPTGRSVRQVSATTEPEMAAFYAGCDIFVFASLREGFGLPPLEAMASGCAVVTTDCGGISDFARDEENCLVVPAGTPFALARAVERLLGDGALRARLAAAAVRTAASWPREKMVTSFIDRVAQAVC